MLRKQTLRVLVPVLWVMIAQLVCWWLYRDRIAVDFWFITITMGTVAAIPLVVMPLGLCRRPLPLSLFTAITGLLSFAFVAYVWMEAIVIFSV